MADPASRATMKVVTDSFARWKAVDDAIHVLRAALSLERAEDGAGSTAPSELEAELRRLQLESDSLLNQAQHALLTLRTPRTSLVDPSMF